MAAAKITAIEKVLEELKDRIATLEVSLKKASTSEPKPKRQHKPRGPSAWNLFTKHVHAEMTAENPGTKFKAPEIEQEAKRRKEAGDYDEAHWKAVLERSKASVTASEVEHSATEAEESAAETVATKKSTKVAPKKAEAPSEAPKKTVKKVATKKD
jgi:hypothetical protein